jgi:hypothetical protein
VTEPHWGKFIELGRVFVRKKDCDLFQLLASLFKLLLDVAEFTLAILLSNFFTFVADSIDK